MHKNLEDGGSLIKLLKLRWLILNEREFKWKNFIHSTGCAEFWWKRFKALPGKFVITSDNKKLKGDLKGVSIIFPIKFEKKQEKNLKRRKVGANSFLIYFQNFRLFKNIRRISFAFRTFFIQKVHLSKGFIFQKVQLTFGATS